MPEFPTSYTNPALTVLSTHGPTSLLYEQGLGSNELPNAGAVWPAANRAIYVQVWTEQPILVQKMAIRVVTQSGNLDIGIYDEKGNRLVSKGSTAVGAAGLQVVDIADTWLTPGVYFLALCVDNTTASILRQALNSERIRTCGVQQQAVGAVTLPATATFANPASSYVPAITASCVATL